MQELKLAERIFEMFLEIMKDMDELLELDYEIVFEKLLNKNSSAKILALLNAQKLTIKQICPKRQQHDEINRWYICYVTLVVKY